MERLEFDIKKVKVVPIDQVRPNTWNPKEKDTDEYQKVKKSIELKGLRQPIIVRDNDGYEIIDGEQRYTSAKELGYQKVIIYDEGKVDDKEAQELTVWYQQQVPFDQIEEAHFIQGLMEKYSDLELPYNELELDEFAEIANFDFNQYSDENPFNEPDGVKTISIKCNEAQYTIIRKAISKVVELEECSEAQALERICADFLAGVINDEQSE